MIRYVVRHGKGRVAVAVIISAIPPAFMKSEKNPDGVPKETVDGLYDGTANHRSQFYKDITIPFVQTTERYTLGASSEFDQQSMIALGSSRTLDVAEPVVEGLPTKQEFAALPSSRSPVMKDLPTVSNARPQ